MALTLPDITISHKNFSVSFPSLSIESGEIVGLFGKSGAGKTSYLKRIREYCDPQDVHYMSQFDGLLEEISVRQNIELGLAATGATLTSAGDWEQKHRTILQDFEVDRHMNKYPRMMSGGQRKRTEIVRSLIMDPKVLLLDEPFTGIGHLFEAICTREILRRKKESTGVTLVVSHDVDLLSTFCDRILLVDDLGVIGMVPVHTAEWQPDSLRAAWTLGVDTILPREAFIQLCGDTLPDDLPATEHIAFWARSAAWNTEGNASLYIPSDQLRSCRQSRKRGETYTHAETDTLLLVGRGVPDSNAEEYVLGIDAYFGISA